MHSTTLCDIANELRQALFVEVDEFVKRAFSDIESGERRHEIVTDEEAEENKVVYYSFDVELDPHSVCVCSEFKHKVFTKKANMDYLVVLGAREFQSLYTSIFLFFYYVFLSYDCEMGLMS